jgi:hypothetical protein
MDAKKDTFVCPHNKEVDCDAAKCEHCGWYPPVAKKRKDEIMALKLYKVPFTGYCEVWAKSPEEAVKMADTVEQQFFAHYDYDDPICLSKEEENELD